MVELAGNLVAVDEVAEAKALCEQVLSHEPENAGALVNLAIAVGAQGDEGAARSLLREALSIEDRLPNAWLQYSRMKRFDEADEPEIMQAEKLCAESGMNGRSGAAWHYVLGKMHHDRKRYEQAFEHYSRANDRMADVLPFEAEGFDVHLEAVTRLMNPDFFESRAGVGHQSARPIFIFGMPRSGTTLVEQIISSHPAVSGGGELPTIPEMAQRLTNRRGPGRSYVDRLASLAHWELSELATDCLRAMEAVDEEASHITDKLPGNYMHLGMVGLLFPNATLIHCRRNPMDVCLSNYFQLFAEGHHYTYSMAGLAKVYSVYHRLMAHWKQHLPVPIFDVTYEELIIDQEAISRALVDHCGLAWDDRCLNFVANDRQVTTASMWQVRQPIYRTATNRWRYYERHLQKLKADLGGVLDDYDAGRYRPA